MIFCSLSASDLARVVNWALQFLVLRLRCQFLRPVHRQVELAAAIVQLAGLG